MHKLLLTRALFTQQMQSAVKAARWVVEWQLIRREQMLSFWRMVPCLPAFVSNPKISLFNEEDIDEVIFEGYCNDEKNAMQSFIYSGWRHMYESAHKRTK